MPIAFDNKAQMRVDTRTTRVSELTEFAGKVKDKGDGEIRARKLDEHTYVLYSSASRKPRISNAFPRWGSSERRAKRNDACAAVAAVLTRETGQVHRATVTTSPLTRTPDLRWVAAHCRRTSSTTYVVEAKARQTVFTCSPGNASTR